MLTFLATSLILIGVQVQTLCADSSAELSGAVGGERHLVCQTVERAEDLFATCGLKLDPGVTVAVVDHMPPGLEDFLGIYYVRSDRIEVLGPQALAEDPTALRLYNGVGSDTLFAAVLTHELAHAATAHSGNGAAMTLSSLEYIASAMQLASMPEAERALFLSSLDIPEIISPSYFNPIILSMRPEKFAALAYLHFADPENGCDFVAKLLSGEVVLGDLEEGM